MTQTFVLSSGVTLRCFPTDRFKQGCLSLQFVRQMTRQEAPMNALLPAVLLRGTKHHPDLRTITQKLDDLYGASVSTLVRRIGDYQTVGLYCAFMEDRYAFAGDEILSPMIAFLKELLLEPVTEEGGFCREFVEGEKRNLILAIESEINDKRAYAGAQLLRTMCKADSFGIPRLGEKAQVQEIDSARLYRHYRTVLQESPVELCYVGAARPEEVAARLEGLFEGITRQVIPLPEQTGFCDGGKEDRVEAMEITQGKLCMGFTTPVTNCSGDFAAMQVLNTLFGAGMTSKLFMNVREKLSLCYSIGSGYYGAKGIMTVSAGIDSAKEPVVRQEILHQLQLCLEGAITDQELEAAKEAVMSSLRGIPDSPGAMEGFYATGSLSGFLWTVEEYMAAVEQVTRERAAAAANTLCLHSTFFLKGVTA